MSAPLLPGVPFLLLGDARPLHPAHGLVVVQPGVAQILVVVVLEADQGEGVPGLDPLERSRAVSGRPATVRRDPVVEPGRVGLVQPAHPRRRPLVFSDRAPRDLERPSQIVIEHGLLPQDLRSAPECAQEVLADLGPVVLGLGVGRAEDDARVRRTEDVRHPPLVPTNRDPIPFGGAEPRRGQEADDERGKADSHRAGTSRVWHAPLHRAGYSSGPSGREPGRSTQQIGDGSTVRNRIEGASLLRPPLPSRTHPRFGRPPALTVRSGLPRSARARTALPRGDRNRTRRSRASPWGSPA